MSFIGIKTPDGNWLELGNIEITFDNKSPVFFFGVITGEKTHIFNLPSTPNNNKYLNFPYNIANAKRFDKILEGFELWLGGLLYATGNLFVSEIKYNSIKVSFQTAASKLILNKDILITSLNLGQYTLPALTGASIEAYMTNTALGSIDTYDFVFAPLTNLAVTTNSENVVNRWAHFTLPPNGFQITNSTFPIAPYFYLHRILEKIGQQIGYTFTGGFITDAELRTLVFYTPLICDNVTFDTTRFLPDITLSQLFNNLATLFCLSFFVDRVKNTIRIKGFNEIIDAFDYVDITSKTNPKYNIELLEQKGTKLSMQTDADDAFPPDYRDFITDGVEPFEEINTIFSHPSEYFQTNNIPPYTTAYYKQPIVNQNYDWPIGADKPSFSARLLFYRGMQPDAIPLDYPLLSSDDLLFDSSPIPGVNYTLDWAYDTGLKAKHWQKYIDFLNSTRRVIHIYYPSLDEFFSFDFAQKVKIKSNIYLVYNQKVTINTNGFIVSELELYRL